jgi:predicted phage terminase large subunit-like protein
MMDVEEVKRNFKEGAGGRPSSRKGRDALAAAKEVVSLYEADIQESQRREVKTELERRLGKKDLVFLLHEVLGYPEFDTVHEELSRFFDNVAAPAGRHRGLILVPRGHLKSTVVTVGKTIQTLVVNPNARVLITNAALDNSKGFLSEIKKHFEKNERFRELYGDYTNDSEKWSETQIIIRQRTRVLKEPSVQATSVDKSVVSQHYDLIIADDIVNRETINTVEQRNKIATYVSDLMDLLEPDGTLILIGTRWHFDDVYGRIIEDNKIIPTYDVFHRTVWKDEEKNIPLFKKFTPAYIEELRRTKGPYEFACQYLNTPVDDETAEFRREWIEQFDLIELETKPFNVFITADPAMKKTERTDWSGFVVNAVTADNKWYILKAYRRKYGPTEFIDELFALKRQYGDRLVDMGVEETAFLVGLTPTIEIKEKEYGIRLNITPIKHSQKAKMDRIRALIPYFERGIIKLSPWCGDLVEETLSFPRGKYDDVLDALAYQLNIATPNGVPARGQTREDTRRPIIAKPRKYT